jgi:PEP-CTERM motif
MNKQLMAAALAAAAVIAIPAHATNVALAANGAWNEFNVDSFLAQNGGTGWIDEDYAADDSALNFTFTIAQGMHGTLTVVDAGFAGDTFSVTNFGNAIGATSGVPMGTSSSPVEFDFDAALANPAYSHGVFTLAAGTYSISGSLLQSVDGNLDATNGAVRLSVSTVPEPASSALMLGGFAALALLARRRKPASAI